MQVGMIMSPRLATFMHPEYLKKVCADNSLEMEQVCQTPPLMPSSRCIPHVHTHTIHLIFAQHQQ